MRLNTIIRHPRHKRLSSIGTEHRELNKEQYRQPILRFSIFHIQQVL